MIDASSQKRFELTVTTQTITTFVKAYHFISQNPEKLLSQSRRPDAPYRIHNQTGHPISIWTDSAESNLDAVKLKDDEEIPWRFDDWRKVRETLSFESELGTIGVKVLESKWDSVSDISINREGESLHSLRPAQDYITHQLVCEVRLSADNVKHVYIRSSLAIDNRTDIPIEMLIVNAEGSHISQVFKIGM